MAKKRMKKKKEDKPYYTTIQVDREVINAIETGRKHHKESWNEILRRKYGLKDIKESD